MTAPFGESPPRTGGVTISERRILKGIARDVAVIRRWVSLFGFLFVVALISAAITTVLLVGTAMGWWHLLGR